VVIGVGRGEKGKPTKQPTTLILMIYDLIASTFQSNLVPCFLVLLVSLNGFICVFDICIVG
jgi:hypothetical protein